jgi:hypothetical protein
MSSKLFGDITSYFNGVSYRDYVAMCKFCNQAEDQLGITTVDLQPWPNKKQGLVLDLVGKGSYQVRWENPWMTLGVARGWTVA